MRKQESKQVEFGLQYRMELNLNPQIAIENMLSWDKVFNSSSNYLMCTKGMSCIIYV